MDVLCIGEMLIDFVPENGAYLPKPGGAPANVACVLAKLGMEAAFCGRVGSDGFGILCRQTLEDAGVSVRYLKMDDAHPTTLALVHLSESGDRSFAFYRTGTAGAITPQALP